MHTSYTEDKEMCEDLKWSHEWWSQIYSGEYALLSADLRTAWSLMLNMFGKVLCSN